MHCFETFADEHRPCGPTGIACVSYPEAELALRTAEGLFGCPSAITGPRPSLWLGLAGHHAMLHRADTFGLTVNNTNKSVCTAVQPLLHTPGCERPGVTVPQGSCMTVSRRQTCSALCAQSPCRQHQLSADNKPQWHGKEK